MLKIYKPMRSSLIQMLFEERPKPLAFLSLISVKMCATHFLRHRVLPASSAPCPVCFFRITDELLRRPNAKKRRAGVARTLYRKIGAF